MIEHKPPHKTPGNKEKGPGEFVQKGLGGGSNIERSRNFVRLNANQPVQVLFEGVVREGLTPKQAQRLVGEELAKGNRTLTKVEVKVLMGLAGDRMGLTEPERDVLMGGRGKPLKGAEIEGGFYRSADGFLWKHRKWGRTQLIDALVNKFKLTEGEALKKIREWEEKEKGHREEIDRYLEKGNYYQAAINAARGNALARVAWIYMEALEKGSRVQRNKIFNMVKKGRLQITLNAKNRLRQVAEKYPRNSKIAAEIKYLVEESPP